MSEWKWDKTKTDFEVQSVGNHGARSVNFTDITGMKFNRLTAEYPLRIKKKVFWSCICECGKRINVNLSSLKLGRTKSCGCIRKETTTAKNKAGFKGCEELTGQYFGQVRWNAGLRNLEFNITVQYAWEIFIKQDRKCIFSGDKLVFGTKREQDQTASLDRIDSSKGYIEGNVQWVHKTINRMKGELSDKEFIAICKSISDQYK